MEYLVDISIIIPIYNGEKWINNCMKSIAAQTVLKTNLKIEIVIFNDGSYDGTEKLIKYWADYFYNLDVKVIATGSPVCKGVGAAKNGAVLKSVGEFLCFQDIDDVMLPNRILQQWKVAKLNHNLLIGSRLSRSPPNSTPRLVRWANGLKYKQLKLQIYTSNGPTILMPTWFCHRSVFDKVGGFVEGSRGTPEDLIFFYSHLDVGGDLYRADEQLVIYTYHKDATTFSVSRKLIWKIQLERLQKKVLNNWNHFTVWNAGKAGRRFVRSLSIDNLNKVVSFCDVDPHKIGHTVDLYCPIKRRVLKQIPVVHFSYAKPPLVICMKLDMTCGQFESNLQSLNLIEGHDYVLFS